MEDGYAICFNQWTLDKEIKNEIRLLLIISSLTAKNGYCYASNKYLADLFQEDEATISRKIQKLVNSNYIKIEYEKRGCEIISRKIRLTKMSFHDLQKCHSTIDKNVKDNNTSINNIRIKENIKRKVVPKWLNEEIESETLGIRNLIEEIENEEIQIRE